MRTISGTLLSAQQGVTLTPYVYLLFTSASGATKYDYSSRLTLLEHHELPYSEKATVLLRNDDVGVADIRGYWTEIEYGCVTGLTETAWAASTVYALGDVVIPTTPNTYKYKCTVAGTSHSGEPTFPTGAGATVADNTVTWQQYGRSGDEHSPTSRLWVKNQNTITIGGELRTLLELNGMWTVLEETQLRLGNPPYYTKPYKSDSIYDIMGAVLSEVGFSLDALGDQDDSIIDTLVPEFEINMTPLDQFASGGSVIYRLIQMTKCYLRSKTGQAMKVMYPQAGDSVNRTFYDNQAPYFTEYTERRDVVVPNYIYLFANAGNDNSWNSRVDATALDDWRTNYRTIPMVNLASRLTEQGDANNRAAAILARIQAEEIQGRGVMPHDCAIELFDKVAFTDSRSSLTYPESATTKVGGLVHRWQPGEYTLEVFLGGVASQFPVDVPLVRPVSLTTVPPFVPPEPSPFVPPPITPPPVPPRGDGDGGDGGGRPPRGGIPRLPPAIVRAREALEEVSGIPPSAYQEAYGLVPGSIISAVSKGASLRAQLALAVSTTFWTLVTQGWSAFRPAPPPVFPTTIAGMPIEEYWGIGGVGGPKPLAVTPPPSATRPSYVGPEAGEAISVAASLGITVTAEMATAWEAAAAAGFTLAVGVYETGY